MSTEAKDLVAVQPIPVQSPSPYVSLLAEAVKTGNLEIAGKMMDLQERWEDRQAEKAFVAALAAFKKHPPEIVKNKKVSYVNKQNQTVEYRHATLDRVTGAIAAGLGEHGLSADWETTQENGRIRVTCFLQHELGHREKRASLEGPPDDSGSKNSVQAIASTVTFLERYTLLAATGLATRDDADGITFGDAEDMLNSLDSAADIDELQERFNKWLKRARAARDKAMMDLVVEAKNRRKAELIKLSDPVAKAKFDEFQALCEKKGLNKANRHMLLAKHATTDAAIVELKTLPDSQAATSSTPAAGEQPQTSVPANSAKETPVEPAKKGREKRGKQVESTGAGGAPKDSPASSPAPKEPDWNF